jgi:hypothetical protein
MPIPVSAPGDCPEMIQDAMTEPTSSPDFRAKRTFLPDEAFALPGPRPAPTDLIAESDWNGIIHLPDDVALCTSNQHGSQLGVLHSLWGRWLEAIGDDKDEELFTGMLDAADCFQASTFNALHGFYRSGISNLRSALELVAIGTLGNLSPEDKTYFRWKTSSIGSLPFRAVTRKLRRAAKSFDASSLRKPLEALYHELSAYSASSERNRR